MYQTPCSQQAMTGHYSGGGEESLPAIKKRTPRIRNVRSTSNWQRAEMLLLGAILLVVRVDSRLEGIVDNHFAVNLVVVEHLDNLGH